MFNRNRATTAPQVFTTQLQPRQSPAASIAGFFRSQFRTIAARNRRRRDRQKLFKYLASDHRAAADIGYPHRLP